MLALKIFVSPPLLPERGLWSKAGTSKKFAPVVGWKGRIVVKFIIEFMKVPGSNSRED